MNYLNIFLVKNGAITRAGASLNIGSKPCAIDLELKKLGIRTLKVEKLTLLDSMTPVSLFGSLRLVKPSDFNVMNLSAEQQGEFFQKDIIAEEAKLLD